jgi:hypothetical protein
MDNGSVSLRQRIARTLSGSISGTYTQNKIIGDLAVGANNGHSISGTAALQQQLGQHLSVDLAYTRLHQSYAGVPVVSAFPDTNREYVSISYQFSRPLGR